MKSQKRNRLAAALAATSAIFLIGCGANGPDLGDPYGGRHGGPYGGPGGCAPLNGTIRFDGQLQYSGTELKGGHVKHTGQRLGNLRLGPGSMTQQTSAQLYRDGADANIRVSLMAAAGGAYTQPGTSYPTTTTNSGSMFTVTGTLQLTQTRLQTAMTELGYSAYNTGYNQYPYNQYPTTQYPSPYPTQPGTYPNTGYQTTMLCASDMAIDVDVYNGVIWNGGVLLYTNTSNTPIYLYF